MWTLPSSKQKFDELAKSIGVTSVVSTITAQAVNGGDPIDSLDEASGPISGHRDARVG